MTRLRAVDAARLGLGALALVRPGMVLRLAGAADGQRVQTIVRVLGARYVVQGAAGLFVDRPWLPAVDATVDTVHGLSVLAAAAAWPEHRHAALASAAAASAFAVADLRDWRSR